MHLCWIDIFSSMRATRRPGWRPFILLIFGYPPPSDFWNQNKLHYSVKFFNICNWNHKSDTCLLSNHNNIGLNIFTHQTPIPLPHNLLIRHNLLIQPLWILHTLCVDGYHKSCLIISVLSIQKNFVFQKLSQILLIMVHFMLSLSKYFVCLNLLYRVSQKKGHHFDC